MSSSNVTYHRYEEERKDLLDLKNPELYTYKEEEHIKEVREKKEEESKKREMELATQEKNAKVRNISYIT